MEGGGRRRKGNEHCGRNLETLRREVRFEDEVTTFEGNLDFEERDVETEKSS